MRVLVHAPGPEGHGVVRHAAQVAGLVAAHGVRRAGPGPADLTHAQFTDALYGPDVAAAAAAFRGWAAGVRGPLVVTLHDVPGADPDPARDTRRRAGYLQVTDVADVVVVSSRHEAAKVRAFSGREPEIVELPLPELPDSGGAVPAWADRTTLGVLGFVYPGKGHAEAIEAAARLPGTPRVVAAGTVSPGHEGLRGALAARAAELGVDLCVTGYLGSADLAAAARAVTVPLAPNRGVSASGSLLAWIASGRVPLAADGDYVREIADRRPGSIRVYRDDAGLDAAAAAACADPTRTRRTGPAAWPDVGALHAALYARALALPGVARC
ncbi:MAG: hypothetical protein OJJ54_11170 [Pseudonocardia sp.]|nr:hypothetical protein [Pseudonocardia sp.]